MKRLALLVIVAVLFLTVARAQELHRRPTEAVASESKINLLVTGAYPEKELRKYCPANTVQTVDKDKAAYVMAFQDMSNRSLIDGSTFEVPFTGVKVSRPDSGELLHSGVTRSFGNAVKDACNAIKKDIANHPEKVTSASKPASQ